MSCITFEMNFLIGGEAGQGLVTIGQMLSRALVKAGYEICATQSYMSRIRGGNNTFAIRISTKKVLSPKNTYDLLVALNEETVSLHLSSLKPDGLLISDSRIQSNYQNHYKVPFEQLGPKKMENTAALGILAALLKLDISFLRDLILSVFGKKDREIVEGNLTVLEKSYEFVQKNPARFCDIEKVPCCRDRMILTGNEALALGAISAGVKFCAFYPMTPSTSIPLTLAHHAWDMGIVVEQVEDEIAAINMAIGASFGGAPSMVTTSGGGFALMCEGVSLAGMTEIPLVIVVAQRPGPATGLPTRTEQADLNLVLYAGHGEFPRAIFAPNTVESCFHITKHAFHLTQKYQSPVFILTDQFLADQMQAVEPFNPNDPHPVKTTTEIPARLPYKRYEITDSGISPRLIPGLTEHLVVSSSDEHTPDGKLTEDLSVRIQMVEKRLRKGEGIMKEVIPPRYEGDTKPDILLMCWGSSYGAVHEASTELREKGFTVGVLSFEQVWPLKPDTFIHYLHDAKRVISVEGNATGQFTNLVKLYTGFRDIEHISKYDGLPFTSSYIVEKIC